MKNVIVICGATATSKTKFAVALAEKLNTEVVSADCMLVYRGLDIGTAKPTKEEMRGVPHHLIDVAAPNERFSVGDYRTAALPVTEKLLAEGKQPDHLRRNGLLYRFALIRKRFRLGGRQRRDPRKICRRFKRRGQRGGGCISASPSYQGRSGKRCDSARQRRKTSHPRA